MRASNQLLLIGVMLGLCILPAYAQNNVTITSSVGEVTFTTGSSSGNLNVQLGTCALGNVVTGNCVGPVVLSGNASGNVGTNSATAISISTLAPIPLTGNGSGTFTASGGLTGSVVNITAGATTFTGTLSALSFNEGLSSNGQATMTATVTGTGASIGTTVNLSGTIQLPAGGNINAVATSNVTTNVSGPFVVPEPASMALFGSGLVVFGGMLRRRQKRL